MVVRKSYKKLCFVVLLGIVISVGFMAASTQYSQNWLVSFIFGSKVTLRVSLEL